MGVPQCLRLNHIHWAILLLFLLVVDSSDGSSEIKGNLKPKSPPVANDNGTITNNANVQKGGANSSSSFVGVAHLDKEERIKSTKEVMPKDMVKRNISRPIKPSEDKNAEISENSSSLILKDDDKEENDSIGRSGEGFPSKRGPAKDDIEEMSGSSMSIKKEKLRDEECDPSYMCIDEKKNLTACLRIPGNDSPDLSLLIQNKGTGPVLVTITAPEFVQLEESKVQLQGKEDKKVKVSLAHEGMDSLIILTTEDSRCTLNFRDLIPQNFRVETRYAFRIKYLSNFSRSHCIIFLVLTVFLLFGCAWVYFGLHKKVFLGNGYETIKMELPVSGVVKTTSGTNDGWDNSWDDRWDDEEAPKTPTMPATPNLSSRTRSLASRRLSKEGWKD